MGVSDEVRSEIKATLLKTLAEVETQLRNLEDSSKPVSLDTPIGRVSRADAMQHQQMTLAAFNREKQRLALLQNALDRIDRPDFGDCMSCGQPIALVRLRYYPEATRCVQCAGA